MSQKFKAKKYGNKLLIILIIPLDELTHLKHFVNGNLFEMIKPAIKQKSNENVMKMMDIIKDKPESWFELISIAIFHQNYQIMKYMIETFCITPQQIPLLNAITIASDISNDSKQKPTEKKDSYLEIECPLIIQSAIGGDIDIFKYLMDNGFGDNLNVTGHITLSRKYKNSVITNCIGASAYYGRQKLLQYILENYQRKVEINFRTIEKRCKAKQSSLTKEYYESTPMHLTIESDVSQETSISCMKILDEFKASLIDNDARGNSLLHVAAKNNKLTIVKYIIEELHMENLAKETNKEGQTPMSLAQNNQGEAICDYLRNNTEQPNENIEQDLMELINTQPKKKGKKKKKKKDKEFGLLNSTDYQETLKINNDEDKVKPKQQVILEKEEKKQTVPVTTKEEEAEYEELEKEEIKRDDYPHQSVQSSNSNNNNYKQNQQQQINSSSSYYQKHQQNSYNNRKNYQQRGYNNEYDYNNDYDYDYYSTGNRKYYDNNYNNKNYYKYNKSSNSNNNQSLDYQQKERGNKKSYYLKEVTSNPVTEKQVEPKGIKKLVSIPQSSEPYIIESKDEKERIVSQKDPSEEENEDNDEEEDFLGEEPKINSTVNANDQLQQQLMHELQYHQLPLEDQIDYTQLVDKYHQLEKKSETIQKEKRELESFIQSHYSTNKISTSSIPSTEENINDLLELANEELEQKSKEIAQLNKTLEETNLTNIKSYNLSKLTQLKELYTFNLKQVEDAIQLMTNKQ